MSGNGEPTSAREFRQVIEIISKLMAEFELVGKIKLVLITNGSLLHRDYVQDGLRLMANITGEVWFKIEAHWQPGAFPNWWSRVGFLLVGQFFRTLWRRRAPHRLASLAHQTVTEAIAESGELAHRGSVIAKRTNARQRK